MYKLEKLNIGLVGCGFISGVYLENLANVFGSATVYACCDLNAETAAKTAAKWSIPHVMTYDEMLDCKEISLILNLTTPAAHYGLTKKALEAGKHVYLEKPLSMTHKQGAELVVLAQKNNVRLGGAPDTFMGAGMQTCRKLIDGGFIGKPVNFSAFLMRSGHEYWHPEPDFYYKPGGGPLFDMGTYYLTALVSLLGSVSEVCGMNSTAFKTRTVVTEPHYGKVIDVEVPTHETALLRFESGVVGTLITSFDVQAYTLPHIEIYGTAGTILAPDPDLFGGPVFMAGRYNKELIKQKIYSSEFKEIPHTHIYTENSRGIGLADMAQSITDNRPHRASGELMCHVLEVMEGIRISGNTDSFYKLKTRCERPEPLPTDIVRGQI